MNKAGFLKAAAPRWQAAQRWFIRRKKRAAFPPKGICVHFNIRDATLDHRIKQRDDNKRRVKQSGAAAVQSRRRRHGRGFSICRSCKTLPPCGTILRVSWTLSLGVMWPLYCMLCWLCWTLTADQLPHAESRGRGGGGGGRRGRLVEWTLSVRHVEQTGLRGRWAGLVLVLLSLGQLRHTHTYQESTTASTLHPRGHNDHHLL